MLLVGGCGGGNGSDDSGGDSAARSAQGDGRGEGNPLSAPMPADEPRLDNTRADFAAGDDGLDTGMSIEEPAERNAVTSEQEAADLLEEAAVISKAVVFAEADDVEQARREVVKVMDTYSGELAADESATDDEGEMESTRMVLRIPSDDYDDAYLALRKISDRVQARSGEEDVTTEVIDVEARIRAQEQSLARIEALLSQAQKLRTIIAIESQLSRRQADLDSLKSRQAYLENQTSMATITVHIEKTSEEEKKKDDDDKGFLAGLSEGWDGLVAAAVGIATVVGVLLPFAIVVALLWVPLMMLVRRLRPVRPVVEDQPSA